MLATSLAPLIQFRTLQYEGLALALEKLRSTLHTRARTQRRYSLSPRDSSFPHSEPRDGEQNIRPSSSGRALYCVLESAQGVWDSIDWSVLEGNTLSTTQKALKTLRRVHFPEP